MVWGMTHEGGSAPSVYVQPGPLPSPATACIRRSGCLALPPASTAAPPENPRPGARPQSPAAGSAPRRGEEAAARRGSAVASAAPDSEAARGAGAGCVPVCGGCGAGRGMAASPTGGAGYGHSPTGLASGTHLLHHPLMWVGRQEGGLRAVERQVGAASVACIPPSGAGEERGVRPCFWSCPQRCMDGKCSGGATPRTLFASVCPYCTSPLFLVPPFYPIPSFYLRHDRVGSGLGGIERDGVELRQPPGIR